MTPKSATLNVTLSLALVVGPALQHVARRREELGVNDYFQHEIVSALTPDVATLNAMLENAGIALQVLSVTAG